jgi:hypothetical protein
MGRTFMKKILGGVVAGIILVTGLNGGVAQAATTFNDNPNDASSNIDMNRVTVSRTTGRAVLVRTNFSDLGRRLNAVEYFFDTKRRNVGPEYGAVIYRGKDGDGIKRVDVYRMKSFTDRGALVTCRWRYKWFYNGRGPGYFNAKFPLGCFEGNGERFVRVHVKAWNFTRYRGERPHRRGVFGSYDNMGLPKAWTHTV